jgi:hypothetical protein
MKQRKTLKDIKTFPSYIPLSKPTVRSKLRDAGKNCYQEQFDEVGRFIMDNFHSFDLSTFYASSKGREIPADEIPALFAAFTREMKAQGRIREVAGCYESSVWVCV